MLWTYSWCLISVVSYLFTLSAVAVFCFCFFKQCLLYCRIQVFKLNWFLNYLFTGELCCSFSHWHSAKESLNRNWAKEASQSLWLEWIFILFLFFAYPQCFTQFLILLVKSVENTNVSAETHIRNKARICGKCNLSQPFSALQQSNMPQGAEIQSKIVYLSFV